MLVDSHAHLDFVEDLENALLRAKDVGVGKIVTIGTSIESSKKATEIADKYSSDDLQIHATCGFHPKDAKEEVEKLGLFRCFKTVKQIAQSSKKVIAIGECGLDYYEQETGNNKQETTDEEKNFQRELFEGQIKLAAELNLPLVIHCRNAWGEIFEIISKITRRRHSRKSENQILNQVENDNVKGVFHSWTGDWTAAQLALDLGFYISFSGIVTFKNALTIQEAAKKAPLDRILIETDCPFLAPDPIRGQKNEPKNVKIIASFIAKLRNQPLDEIASATSQNVSKLFAV